MTLHKSKDGKITLVAKQRLTLDELLAQCNPKAPPPVDMARWDTAPPAGQEIW